MWAGANQWIGSGPPQRISIYHTSTIKGSNIKIMVCTNCNVEFKSAPGFSCNILHEPLLSKLVNITIIRSSICVGGGNYKRVAYWPLAWATLAKNWSIIGNWPGSILFWIALYIFIPTIQNLYYMYTQDSTSKHSIGCNIRVNLYKLEAFIKVWLIASKSRTKQSQAESKVMVKSYIFQGCLTFCPFCAASMLLHWPRWWCGELVSDGLPV